MLNTNTKSENRKPLVIKEAQFEVPQSDSIYIEAIYSEIVSYWKCSSIIKILIDNYHYYFSLQN